MKLTLILSLFLLVTKASFSQNGSEDCKKCGTREVYCFDVAVQVKNPYALTLTQECLNDPECVTQMEKWRETWKSYHQVSSGYKKTLRQSGEMPENCVAFFMQAPKGPDQWIIPDLYASTRSENEPSALYIPYSDGANAAPTYSQLPPRPDWTDYITYGTLNEASGNMMLEIKCWNFRRSEEVWTGEAAFNPDDKENFQCFEQEGKNAAGGSAQKLVEAIKRYEKGKRDKSNEESKGLIALEPELKSEKEKYSVAYDDIYMEPVNIKFTLTDCDGTLLKNRELNLKVSAGKLALEKVLTDENGEAIAVYTADDNTRSATLNASWKFEYPSGRENMVSKDVKINVIKPVDSLLADVTLVIYSKTTRMYNVNGEKKIESVHEKTWDIRFKAECRINDSMLKRFKQDPKTRTPAAPSLIYGKTRISVVDWETNTVIVDRRYPLKVNIQSKLFNNNWVNGTAYPTTKSETNEGLNEVEGIKLTIKVPDYGELAPLVARYVILFEGGISPSEMSKRDPKLGIPYNTAFDSQSVREDEVKSPLLIDAAGLDAYLTNPSGSYKTSAKGSSNRQEGDAEYIQTAEITINFTPITN